MKFKYIKLLLSIVLDLVGVLSYFVPSIGEFFDVIWAPLSAFIILKMYDNQISKYAATVSFIEEILPFTDIFPTFTITWLVSVWYERKESVVKT